MKLNKTKEKILDTSIRLFNEKKASNVSTVQISAEMKISPGNLYYYYANKEEIIRCIWNERMVREIKSLLESFENIETAKQFLEFFEGVFSHCFKYKFFYTEISTLFFNDDKLIEVYSDVENFIKDAACKIYEKLVENGKFINTYEDNVVILATNGMALLKGIISDSDIAAVKGVPLEDRIEMLCVRMTAYISLFFTESMKNEMAEELAARGMSIEKYIKLD